MDDKAEKVALFRYGLIAPLVLETLPRGELTRRAQAQTLCAALAALTQPTPAPDFVHRALTMLQSTGWTAAHRFLFAGVRCHLLGWPRGLAPDGRRAAFSAAAAPA